MQKTISDEVARAKGENCVRAQVFTRAVSLSAVIR